MNALSELQHLLGIAPDNRCDTINRRIHLLQDIVETQKLEAIFNLTERWAFTGTQEKRRQGVQLWVKLY